MGDSLVGELWGHWDRVTVIVRVAKVDMLLAVKGDGFAEGIPRGTTSTAAPTVGARITRRSERTIGSLQPAFETGPSGSRCACHRDESEGGKGVKTFENVVVLVFVDGDEAG
jgi:hypothetical protein